MAYVNPNYQTKKEFKSAVAAGIKHRPFNVGLGLPTEQNGKEYIEGPHYPFPHKWYAEVDVVDGVVMKVR